MTVAELIYLRSRNIRPTRKLLRVRNRQFSAGPAWADFGWIFLASGGALLYKGISGKYICIAGIVKQVEAAGFRRKPKAIFLDVEGRIPQLPAPPKTTSIVVGDKFTVFLSPDTPIYEQDGTYRAFTCLALVNER